MFCPECRVEFVPGTILCPECGATLTPVMPLEDSTEHGGELVPVFKTADGPLLAIVKGALESAGIPFAVQGEGGMNLFPLGRFAIGVMTKRVLGAMILVPQARAHEAKEFLQSFDVVTETPPGENECGSTAESMVMNGAVSEPAVSPRKSAAAAAATPADASLSDRKEGRFIWIRLLKRTLLVGATGFALLNGVAWMQASSMMHFSRAEHRTKAIEKLSRLEKARTLILGVSIPRPENDRTPADFDLPFDVRRIALPEGDWLEGWYVPHPAARGMIVMFHGYAASKSSLLSTAAAFHQLGYELLLIDFRGSGGSSGTDTTLGVHEATDVARSLAYARETWSGHPVILYGVSMGSAAVLRAISKLEARPEGIILESPFDRLLNAVKNRFHLMGLPSFPAAQLLVFWGSVPWRFNGFAHNPADYAADVRCPALVLHGDRDTRATTVQVNEVFGRLAGSKRLVVFPDAGHQMLVEASPEVWRREVGRFLERVEAGN